MQGAWYMQHTLIERRYHSFCKMIVSIQRLPNHDASFFFLHDTVYKSAWSFILFLS
jgi:hypothetical protein